MSRDAVNSLSRASASVVVLVLSVALLWAVLWLPAESAGLAAQVDRKMNVSGVENPVTAVLLNFRSYDTLLELAVLFLALIAIWGLSAAPAERAGEPVTRFLTSVASVLTPLIVLVGGFVLWTGSHLPGGAFQAGAVIAAAGVLLLLAGLPAVRLREGLVRAGVVAGPLLFVGLGLACLTAGRSFLEYPQESSKTWIMLIEAASTVSIALILTGVFAGSAAAMAEAGPEEDER